MPQVLRAPLEITKALASPIPFINEPAEFIIAVSNQYTTTQENIEIVDWLPEGLTYVPDSLVIPDGSTVTLNEDNEVVWTVDALEVAQSYELQFAVSMSGELLGQEIVNTTRVESINGEPATEMEDNTTFVPVMCEGGLKPDRDEINVRDNPNLTDTEVVYQLTADETVGVIGITFSPEGAEQGHPWWYRIVIPVEDDQEEETPSDEPEVTFVFGWITGSFFASECENTPLLDRYGHLVPLPHQSSDQQLAFTGVVRNVAGIDDNDWVEYKVYSIAQIADKTNWSGNNPPITPITTLPTGTPVIISAIHPNRQYVRVRYLTEDGELTTAVDQWIRARITTNQN
ncbi:MAG: DUF11 domain-containing protein [Pseudorhodoplanes sp.]|nr:DUF11 domain-containing protein [Pseudorhodoplanes sp.]